MTRIWLLLICCTTLIASTNGQTTTPIGNVSTVSTRYAIGLSAQVRQAPQSSSAGLQQAFWRMCGGGVSALRYTSNRLFWNVGLSYTTVDQTQKPVPDLRLVFNTSTNQYERVNLGAKTERWKYRYFTVPISFNYLLFNKPNTNLYVTGGVVLDWLYRYKREINATYDGRFDVVTRGSLEDITATLLGGFGLYQPIGSRFLLMAGPSTGYTFLSKFEKDAQSRPENGYEMILLHLKLFYRLGDSPSLP